MWWFWVFVGPALLLALSSLAAESDREKYVRFRLSSETIDLLPASVIVPVKGMDETLSQNLEALASLDYPDYELIIAAQRAADIPPGVLPPRVKVVLAPASDSRASEKVDNLMGAVIATRKYSAIFAFADSDGCVTRNWLRALVGPLSEPGVGAATGFRWFIPEPATFWSLLRSTWDAVAAGMLGKGDNPFAWGGAMAIRKQIFYEAGVLSWWKGAISDDYTLAAAVHAAGLTIAYAPGALVPSLEHISARHLFEWTRRQMMITRFYSARQWWLGLGAHFLYCAAMVASVTAGCHGHRVGWWTLAGQLAPGIYKGGRRLTLAHLALPEYTAWFRRHGWFYVTAVPLATWLWLIALVSSAFGKSIKWRGRRYELKRGAAGTQA